MRGGSGYGDEAAAAEASSLDLVGAAPDADDRRVAQRDVAALRGDRADSAPRQGFASRGHVMGAQGEEDVGRGVAARRVRPHRRLEVVCLGVEQVVLLLSDDNLTRTDDGNGHGDLLH